MAKVGAITIPKKYSDMWSDEYKRYRLQIGSCEIPDRMKELLYQFTTAERRLKHVNKFIWDSLTPDEQFTCLMAFPDEIKQLLGE